MMMPLAKKQKMDGERTLPSLAPLPGGYKCPTRRFGRTNLQLSVITCGGMRFQQTWSKTVAGSGTAENNYNENVERERFDLSCQNNVEAIVKRAQELGINHIETARAYGSSEVQLGLAFRKLNNRDAFYLQSKCRPCETVEAFRDLLEATFSSLGNIKKIDLLALHGINRSCHLEWATHCVRVLREYRQQGRISFIGFSTHAPTPLIIDAINLNVDGEQAFDYVNLHMHFVGSHTSSGTHKEISQPLPSQYFPGRHSNRFAVRAARKRDMGIFIISPFDKGGRVYQPSKKFFDACCGIHLTRPVSPVSFVTLWGLADEDVHTMVVGVAGPKTFDEQLEAVALLPQAGEILPPIETALNAMWLKECSKEKVKAWWRQLPGVFENETGAHLENALWLFFCVEAWGLLEFSRNRYQMLFNNTKKHAEKWAEMQNSGVSLRDRHKSCSFDWAPGFDLSVILNHPFLSGDGSDGKYKNFAAFPEDLKRALARDTTTSLGDVTDYINILKRAHAVLSPLQGDSNVDLSAYISVEACARAINMQDEKDWPDRKVALFK